MDVALSINGKPYCVYHHVCDGKVFYIGSGTMARPFTRDGRNRRWLQFVKENPNYEIRIDGRFQDLREARIEESKQIKDQRPLCNGKDASLKPASTTEHISIRIPADVMTALRRQSLERERSLSWLIVKKLSERSLGGDAQSLGGGDAAPRSRSVSAGTSPNLKSCPDCGSLSGHQKWCKAK